MCIIWFCKRTWDLSPQKFERATKSTIREGSLWTILKVKVRGTIQSSASSPHPQRQHEWERKVRKVFFHKVDLTLCHDHYVINHIWIGQVVFQRKYEFFLFFVVSRYWIHWSWQNKALLIIKNNLMKHYRLVENLNSICRHDHWRQFHAHSKQSDLGKWSLSLLLVEDIGKQWRGNGTFH